MEKYCPSKSNAFYLDEQSDQEKEDTQKEIVFTSNEVVILMMPLDKRNFSLLLGASLSLGIPST